jgi:ribosomal protein S18 acetylase RimI-like enzyme
VRIPASPQQPPAALFADLPVVIGQVALLRETAEHVPFLRRLYRSTREEELALTGWPETMKQLFCDHQFDLQRAHYRRQHPQGEFLVIRAGAETVGRLYLDAGGETVHLIDIALLPAWRGCGIGSSLLQCLQTRAAAAGKAMSLNVLTRNRHAIALYRRLGFADESVAASHMSMCWRETPAGQIQLKTAS